MTKIEFRIKAVEFCLARIGVGLQSTLKVLQMLSRMLTLAIS